ncbi:MAG: methylglyoxal synthase [bacterium]
MKIALIAHDAKKKLMQNFCIAYRGILSKHEVYATGTTGRLIEEVTNLNVKKLLTGHLGGMQQVAAMIDHNEIDLVIFLRDPDNPKSHEPDVNIVIRICDRNNIPLASNLATAELLIKALDRGDYEWREMYK